MDPDETMRMLRDRLIQLSDVVSRSLVQGGSVLTKSQVVEVHELLQSAEQNADDLMSWSGYWPVQK